MFLSTCVYRTSCMDDVPIQVPTLCIARSCGPLLLAFLFSPGNRKQREQGRRARRDRQGLHLPPPLDRSVSASTFRLIATSRPPHIIQQFGYVDQLIFMIRCCALCAESYCLSKAGYLIHSLSEIITCVSLMTQAADVVRDA